MKQHRSVGRLISRIHRFSHIHLGRKLDKYDIGSGQLHFLMRLYHQDGTNQECLARHCMTDKATSARAIRKLEEAGYITRKRDDADRRAYQVFLTEKAKKMRPAIRNIMKAWTDTLLNGFTEDERGKLFDFLERISENASAASASSSISTTGSAAGTRNGQGKESGGCKDGE